MAKENRKGNANAKSRFRTAALGALAGGADGKPETASRGETVNAAVSLKNNTTQALNPVLVRVTAQNPAGA